MIAPLVSLSFGAGVQSTALLSLVLNRDERLMAAMGGELPECAIFADPRSEEPDTYAHVWVMAKSCAAAGLPLYVVSAGDLLDDILNADRFASIPAYTRAPDGSKGILRRQCTREYKLAPIHQQLRRLMGLQKGEHVKRPVRSWIGISLDEINRAKPSRYRWETKVYPLLEMRWRRSDCLNYLRERGLEHVGKSSCVFCPFHSNQYWLEMKRRRPESWARAISADESIRRLHQDGRGGIQNPLFIHRSATPLETAELGEAQGDLFDDFDNECEGMCGL